MWKYSSEVNLKMPKGSAIWVGKVCQMTTKVVEKYGQRKNNNKKFRLFQKGAKESISID